MARPLRIFLTGFSGTGKSAVAPLVARALGWELVDTDALVELAAAKSVADIFRDDGEERFRELESNALRETCSRENAVISAGGGTIMRPENRAQMADGAFVVCLEAKPETILDRLQGGAGSGPLDRPLLAGSDPLARICELKAERQAFYALCDWTIHTDALAPSEVAAEVLRSYERFTGAAPDGAACLVRTASRRYAVFVRWGSLIELGQRLREAGVARHAYVISDEAVFHHYGDEIENALRKADIPFDSYAVPPGEASKSLEMASNIYDWLVQHKAERGHTIVALGGGMITDLAGHVAATYARGLPLVHVPTSLLAMADASIGGKVGVNHAQAKNLIGSFYQPRLVLIDPATLRTLSPRDLHSGWAEVIKHAFIADADLIAFLEENAEGILKLDPEPASQAIQRSVQIKAEVVSQDEREETGLRATLNYGHTLAHAIESATAYTRYLHSEAVAIGMTASATMSVRMGLLGAEVAVRQKRLLERYHLPTRAEGLDRVRIEAAMALDKKVEGKAIRWVLLAGAGRPVLRNDVPPDVVTTALNETLGGA